PYACSKTRSAARHSPGSPSPRWARSDRIAGGRSSSSASDGPPRPSASGGDHRVGRTGGGRRRRAAHSGGRRPCDESWPVPRDSWASETRVFHPREDDDERGGWILGAIVRTV